ncbi:MAG TPA: DNA replication/repair protein RecF [Candidatus Saccharimonadales bacterium]|nr:DNA replication/repair protein RecF [Candidatus Saccharimonadales bacterium]
MAVFDSLHLQHFRSYNEHEVVFGSGVNIIVGPNGSGKTNLLEALFVLASGSSFRGHDRDLLQRGQEWFRLDGIYGEQRRSMTLKIVGDTPEKQFTLDGAKRARLTHQFRVPVVLFEPDHLRLLRESPSKRRDYLDTLLTTLQPDYAWLKHQFERVLVQRNAVLKRRIPFAQLEDQLFAWDVKFAELSQHIVARRKALIGLLQQDAAGIYSAIARRPHTIAIEYQSSVTGDNYRAALLRQLSERVTRDIERGFTGVGPQRDDFAVVLNGAQAAVAASRGEMRSLLLALKIIELRLVAEHQDATPLLLLDDVFSELDSARRQALAELAKSYQTLITTTDADAITGHFKDGYNIIRTEQAAS